MSAGCAAGARAGRNPAGRIVCRGTGASGRVPGMFVHSTRSWWWTAHPAAH
ncbi:trp operon leader peptide [Streptomyces sp. NPDC005955]|uniref:trp operon leader peptide n=1 Tax=Streptomyces sp. NPDC005955 TaxID=3364738 RepID=UPI0036A61CB2